MKKTLKNIALAALIAAMALVMTGCMSRSADEMYSLPQLQERYIQLQNCINEVLSSGAEYSAPTSGSYRQAVQLIDLDSDGTDEAVAFFTRRGEDKPLKVYVFRKTGTGYEVAATIEGEGTSFDNIGFPDMNGDGVLEIALGWKLTVDVNMLSVYAMNGYTPASVISTDYQEYTITQLSGRDDIAVIRLSGAELTGEVEHYTMTRDGEVESTSARLSTGIDALLRIRQTVLSGGENAILIEETTGGNNVTTDILAYRDEHITNITRDETSGISSDTTRAYAAYCRDINGDGALDVPNPVPLATQSESASYYVLEWYTYSINGKRRLVETTYNNYSDGWYMTLPGEWSGNMTVRRADTVGGERIIVFSEMEGDEIGRDFLAIYTLSGDNRYERVKAGNRFVLKEEDSVIYAAEILSDVTGAKTKLTEDEVRSNFDIIYSEWITGDI